MARRNFVLLVLVFVVVGCTSSAPQTVVVRETVEVLVTVVVTATPESSETSNTTVTAATQVSAIGATRDNPVPMGQLGVVALGSGLFKVGIAETVRGQDVFLRMSGQRVAPDEGKEWFAVRMIGECLKSDDTGSYFGYIEDFEVFANGRSIIQRYPLLEGPARIEPDLFEKYVTGAELDGWVVLQTYPDDPAPLMLIRESSMLGVSGQPVWFALSK